MKLVGICEKIAVFSMVGVVGILLVATLLRDVAPLPTGWQGFNNALALFGMVSFSLSAVMSTPQVVKGLKGDAKRIRAAIATGLGINLALIFIITLMTLLGAGGDISEDGALVDLSRHLGGWVAIVGYILTLLALAAYRSGQTRLICAISSVSRPAGAKISAGFWPLCPALRLHCSA